MKRYWIFTILALISAYAPDWGRYYVEIFQKNATSEAFQFKTTRSEKPKSIAYSFEIKPENQKKTLSLGVVWPQPEITCDNRIYSNPGDAIASDKNRISTVALSNFRKCEQISFSYNKTPGYFLYGRFGGTPFLSDAKTAESYKRIVDFFFGDIRLLLIVIVLAYLFLQNLSVSKINSSEELGPIERYSLPWGLFLLCSAGIFEILLPWEGVREQIPKLNTYFSAIAHLGPGIDYISRRYTKKVPPARLIGAVFLIVLFFPDRMFGFVSIGLPIALLTFIATIGAAHIGPYRLYSLLLGVNFVKLAGGFGIDPTLLPHFHVVSIYIGLVIGNDLVTQLKSVGVLSDFVSWSRMGVLNHKAREDLKTILQKGLEISGCKQAEIVLVENGYCQIYTVQNPSFAKLVVDIKSQKKLPPLYAAIMTSNEAVLLIDGASERGLNLRKSPYSEDVGFISAAPIMLNGACVGAISFQGLPRPDDPKEIIFHGKIFELFMTHLESAMRSIFETEVSKTNLTLVEAMSYFSEAPSASSEEHVIKGAAEKLFEELNCKGVFFSYSDDSSQYEPRLYFGLNGECLHAGSSLNIKISENNEHGPFVLAVRNRKPVFVNQTSLIEDVLRGRTSAYLRMCNTKAIGILPIVRKKAAHSEVEKVQHVLMVQSDADNYFSSSKKNILSQYIGLIEDFLYLRDTENEKSRHQEILNEFIPASVSKLIFSGENTRLSSEGFFGCLDLIGSSGMLNKNGDEWFRGLANDLGEFFSTNTSDVRLATMNWDAFYFQSTSLESLIEFFQTTLGRLPSFRAIDGTPVKLSFRLCVTHGDTSLDFCEGNGFKRWTVVGAAMANVCKFEQKVKNLGEGIFIDPLALAASGRRRDFEIVTTIEGCEVFSPNAVKRVA